MTGTPEIPTGFLPAMQEAWAAFQTQPTSNAYGAYIWNYAERLQAVRGALGDNMGLQEQWLARSPLSDN